jgi:hypothetical protein
MEKFSPNPKFGHLEKDFKPIQVCIGDTDNDVRSFFNENIEKFMDEKKLDNINYNADNISFYTENNMLNGGFGTYVISDVNSKDKCTTGLFDCTSLLIVGEDSETGKNISIPSHQNPKKIFKPEVFDLFKKHLSESLQRIFEKSKRGSIDAVIVGGNTLKKYKDFIRSVKLIDEICQNTLHLEPVVATGPKEDKGWTNAYFENEKRRLYIFMTEQKENLIYHDFPSKNIDEQINKIKDKKSNDKK